MSEKRILLVELESGRTRPIRESKAAAASPAWDGFFVEEDTALEIELKDVCLVHHVAALSLDTTLAVEWKSDGRSISKTIEPGQVSFVPARLPFAAQHRTGGGMVSVAIEPKFLLSATAELDGFEHQELLCSLGVDDAFLRELILTLRAESQNGLPGECLYAETVMTTLAMHLARKYSARRPRLRDDRDYRGGLTKFQLRRVMDFVQEHLAENISLEAMAGVAGLSVFHFARMFKQSTGVSPHRYVIRSRVVRARELLLVRTADIADVAAQVGFCDQSHLASHFRRVYGLTPSQFFERSLGSKILL